MKSGRRRSGVCSRKFFQVFSVTIHFEDEALPEQPLKLRIGDNSTATDLSLSTDLLTPSKKKKKTLKLYGTVKIVEVGVSDIILYHRDKQNPELITSGDTLSLFSPTYHCPLCLGSDVHIDLHEADQDLEISRGYLYFNDRVPDYDIYFDNRFSSVILGQHGSATVFYTFLNKAASATVKANLVITNISTTTAACVYGCLSVRYAGHDYASYFLKHHYRPLLFKKSPTNAISLNQGAALLLLPLDIPVVGVPNGTSLIIEADLHVVCGESEVATLGAEADFPFPDELGSPPHSQTVEGSNCSLQVTVTN